MLGEGTAYGWRCVVSLVVAVGAGDHYSEIYALLTSVCDVGGGDAGALEGTFVACDRGWVRALADRWVQTGIALDVDVEGGTQSCVIAPLTAAFDVIGREGVEAEVGVCADGGVEVLEDFDVIGWGVWTWDRAIAVGLWHARIIRSMSMSLLSPTNPKETSRLDTTYPRFN